MRRFSALYIVVPPPTSLYEVVSTLASGEGYVLTDKRRSRPREPTNRIIFSLLDILLPLNNDGTYCYTSNKKGRAYRWTTMSAKQISCQSHGSRLKQCSTYLLLQQGLKPGTPSEQACSTCVSFRFFALFVLFRETERLWENWLITKTAFPSPMGNNGSPQLPRACGGMSGQQQQQRMHVTERQ